MQQQRVERNRRRAAGETADGAEPPAWSVRCDAVAPRSSRAMMQPGSAAVTGRSLWRGRASRGTIPLAMNHGESFGPLVDVAWLHAHAGDPDVRVIDVRWYMRDRRGADEYARGHVPGAVFVDLDRDLSAPVGPGRHPLPAREAFERAMRRAGVSAQTRVVAYDDAGGSIAARLWWLLRYFGHARVAVLDGGLPAWTAAGHPLVAEVPAVPEGTFTAAPPRDEATVDKAYVAAARTREGVLLLDARAPERYRGEVEPVDARPGHIPGARNAPWAGNLEAGRFRSPEALRARFEELGVRDAREAIVYCGSGVTACHDLLAMERAGLPGAKLYVGSWSDWAQDPSLPGATGEG
jgi:thiosulfate/3-mercaptopyruvate sulfurtransferase